MTLLLNLKKTFNGKNCYNNEIYIDFKENKVDFNPIKFHWIMPYLHMLSLHIFIPLKAIPYIVFFTVVEYILYISYHEIRYLYFYLLSMVLFKIMLVLLLVGIISSLIYFYRPWRQRYFPKYNATMCNILTFGFLKKRCNITSDMLKDNRFIIPRFKNIVLEYEMTGDFQKYAQSIDIKALKKLQYKGYLIDDPYNFKATFYFDDVIKDGMLKVRYI